MDDGLQSQEYLSLFESISDVFMGINAHTSSEIIVWLVSFYDLTTTGFVGAESA